VTKTFVSMLTASCLQMAALAVGVGVSLVTAPVAAAADPADLLDIEVGKSVVIETPRNATAISITNPEVADIVTLASANKIQVQGKSVGSTDLVIQQGAGVPPRIYQVNVHRDLTDLVRLVDEIVEGTPPMVYPLKDRIAVQGAVADLDTLERVSQVASLYDEKFVNLMTVRGDHQVQLEVVFAEVSRGSLRELGLNTFYGNSSIGVGLQQPGGFTTSTVASPDLAGIFGTGLVPAAAAGTFQLLGRVSALDLSTVLSIMEDHRMSRILSQPVVTSLSGQQADLLAGGRIPIPAAGGNGAVQVQYQEYGVKLTFLPTVLAGNVIDMDVTAEVSEPDFANGTRLTGIEVPGFISRKGKTHLRVESGLTFAMAGMLDERTVYTRAEVPGLGRLPLIGALFRYTKHSRSETELMMFVTPRLVRPLGPGEVPPLPGSTENLNPSDVELFLLGMGRRPGSRTAQPTGAVGLQR
jgi:pilus assembly protein CpaC